MYASFADSVAASFESEKSIEALRVPVNKNGGGGGGGFDPALLPPSPPDSNSSSPADDPASSFLEQAYRQSRFPVAKSTITHFLELWDYMGGCSFRGFISTLSDPTTPNTATEEKSLFLFLTPHSDLELKHGLLALIELATECFECENLVLAIDRQADGIKELVRDLGWVGFELCTLDRWRGRVPSKGMESVSERWIFVGMEL